MMPKFLKLQEEETFFSTCIFERLPDPVFYLDSDACFIYLNNAACRLLECSRQELLSMKLSDIDLDFSQKNWSRQWQSLKQQGSLVVKSRYRTRYDKSLSVKLTLAYVKENNREFGCTFVRQVEKTKRDRNINQNINQFDRTLDISAEPKTQLCCDSSLQGSQTRNGLSRNNKIGNLYQEISQFKEAEAQTAKTLSLLHRTLDSFVCGTVAFNHEGEVLSHNQKFLEIWKIPDSLVLSKDSKECQNFFARQLKNPEVFRRSVWEISRESEAETYDILELKDGRVFAQYSKPQRLDGKIVGRVWSILNITELKPQAESELQKNRDKVKTVQKVEKAKQLIELRSLFISMLCHQFRNSLNIVSFSSSLLKRYGDKWNNEKRLAYFTNIEAAVERIAELLDKMVFFGKSEVGQIEFEPKSVDLAGFCRSLTEQLQPLSDSKQQTIDFFSNSNCQTTCIDENILHHILTNLLSNAIKYSQDGSKIEFEVLCENEQAIIKIKDRGIGISEVDQQRLFEPFFRGSNVDSISGSGLGLSIVKNLVEIHGGEIELESKVGIGTTFLLTFDCCEIEKVSNE